MVLKLYGQPYATCAKRVLTILKETNTPFEFIGVKNDEMKTPSYMQKQPFGQVPYIEDDGLVIFESRAISRYIATKAGSALVPTGSAHDVARFEQALSIEAFNFNPFAEGITWQREFNPLMGRECDEARVRDMSNTLEGKIAGYERILSKSKYLAGERITIADLFHLPYGVHLAPLGFKYLEDEEKYPNVARWWKDIMSRQSWQEVKDWNEGL